MSMNTNTRIDSTRAAEPVGPYPHARRAGNLLFLSGVGPRKRGTKDIPGSTLDASGNLIDYSIEAEILSCFENIRNILEDAGSRWENIIDVTVFLTNMKRDWTTYNKIYAQHFPAGPNQPTRTTCEIVSLPTGGNSPIHFEIKVIATI